MREPTAIETLLALVDEAFDRTAWHGPTLRAALRGVSPRQAEWRPGPRRHNIHELTLHAAYWKHVVRRRLTGDRSVRFPLDGSNWFAVDRSRTWKEDIRLLADEHRKLRAVVAAFPARRLHAFVIGRRQTAAFTIRGIAAHDLYHAGQIQLIKTMMEW